MSKVEELKGRALEEIKESFHKQFPMAPKEHTDKAAAGLFATAMQKIEHMALALQCPAITSRQHDSNAITRRMIAFALTVCGVSEETADTLAASM